MEWNENITGLQHIGIPTNDMDKTVDFYQKIGFEIAHEAMDGEVRVVFLKLKDLVLETYENKAAALCDGAVDHIALNVMNIEEDYKFITGLGITLNTGVTCYSPEESTFAKEVKKQASKTILVMDSSKFGQNSLVVQGKVNDYDEIITDSNIAPQQLEEFKNHDIDLLIAGV